MYGQYIGVTEANQCVQFFLAKKWPKIFKTLLLIGFFLVQLVQELQ
jgi:hypothetical protein